MLTMGTALRVVTDWVRDPAKVTSYFVRFSNPVVVPDDENGVEVSFTARVAAVESNRVSIAIEATSGGQKVLGAARAEVDLDPELRLPDVRLDVPLADLTTLRVGGPARRLIAVATESELVDYIQTSMPEEEQR